jgi:hypothetical protein
MLEILIYAVISMTATGCVLDQGEGGDAGQGDETVAEVEQSLACAWKHVTAYNKNSLGEYFTSTQTTSSGCGHLWVANYWSGCVTAYIRYLPSSGGYFDSPRKTVCYNNYAQFSNDVLAGTWFFILSSAKTEFALDM